MTASKNDLRWRRTDEKIKRAFIEQLRKQQFEKITISNVITSAGISRKAFYLHYHDKYDFLARQESQLLALLQAALIKDHQHFKQVLTKQDRLQRQSYLTINHELTILNQHRQIVKALLSTNGDPRFKHQLHQLLANEIYLRIKMYHAKLTTQIPQRYSMAILVDGLFDLVNSWLQNPHPESVDHFAQILTTSRLLAPLDLLRTR